FTYHSYGVADAEKPALPAAFGASQKARSAAMGTWLSSLPHPVAVLAANDLWGSELVQAARERRLHVPNDVAILGVDNEELLCELAHPPLSSIRIGGEQIGRAAVTLLEQLLRGKKPKRPFPRIPPMEVVTRQSTHVLTVEDSDVAVATRYIRPQAGARISGKQL